jgi:leader peptidase (prepilin peptidase) / N-methyltransferase
MGCNRCRGQTLTVLPQPYLVSGGALLGAIIGSFIAALIIRWPAGQSIMRGRSCCDMCGVPIGAIHLIPIASFLWLRGRSTCCDAAINPRHIWIEGACALIGGVALWVAPGWDGLAGALFGWILLSLFVLDAEHFWLPNALTLPLAMTGLVVGWLGVGVPLIDRIIGAVAGYAIFELIRIVYRLTRKREGMGGGDPKLLGAIGAWLGWQWLPMLVLGASVAGLAWLLLKAARGGTVSAADRLPFGALMAVAAFAQWVIVALFQL